MLRDLLSSRLIQAGMVFFVLIVGGSLLYSWHLERTNAREMARHNRFLQRLETHNEKGPVESVTGPNATDTAARVEAPTEQAVDIATETETPELPSGSVSVDAIETAAQAEPEMPKMSRFGLGPYPEIPEEWGYPPNYFQTVESIETELLKRVTIKMYNEGTRSKYGSVGIGHSTRLITALERDSVLIETEMDENGEERIYGTLAHPDDLPQGMYTRVSEIPSHLKVVTPAEIEFDPYEYLGLSK